MTSVILRPLRHRAQSGATDSSDEAANADVVLVGFQDQGNLGMGYLSATLREHGYRASLAEFRDGPDAWSPPSRMPIRRSSDSP